jgi:predicted RNase H-like HicB family nuclease
MTKKGFRMPFIEYEREEDGRWIAEIPAFPGVLVYGPTKVAATSRVKALTLRLIADRLKNFKPARLTAP